MNKVRHGKRLYKQMALEVAVRNPERYQSILETFIKFEGIRLDDEAILDIYAQLYIDGAISAEKLDADNATKEEIKNFIKTNNYHNNEWGFPTGYQAAFTRYLKTLSEFGFIYSQYNEILKLSAVSKTLVNKEITLSEAFSLQCMRFWRKSPYRRVLNNFNYFKFILEVIKKRNADGHKLSYPQFLLSLFSDNGNVDEFINCISENKIGNDPDKAYELACKLYHDIDGLHSRVVKQGSAFNDYGDTVFRVLQLTGFITVEYDGIMQLSINRDKEELLNFLLVQDFTLPQEAFDNEMIYFEHLGNFPQELRNAILRSRQKTKAISGYNAKLANIMKSYNLNKDVVAKLLRNVSDGKSDRLFWYIQAPVKYEFLLTLLLFANFGNEYEYKPNYLCDEAGIPYSHAPGNMGDIEIFNEHRYWLVEATLIRNKKQQINNETINLFRHIDDKDAQRQKYLSLVAPYIHQDTSLMIKVATVISMVERHDFIFSHTYETEKFIVDVFNGNCIPSMQRETRDFAKKLLEILSTFEIDNNTNL